MQWSRSSKRRERALQNSARTFLPGSQRGRIHPALRQLSQIARRGLDAFTVTPSSLFVALHEIGNPGNLGTILRTVDAVGGNGVILIGDSTDPYHPNAVKASTGTLFRFPVVHVADLDALYAWCATNSVSIVTTSAHAEHNYWGVTYPAPCCVLFGNEGRGLSADAIQHGDLAVRIPMHGSATSLNLAVSAGVLLYELLRQREMR